MTTSLPEDQYGEIVTDTLLRWWLSIDIPRTLAERSLSKPTLAPSGSYIVRRSQSSPGNYAITVVQGNKITSYEVFDMGLGQVGLRNGRAFPSLQYLLEHFYTLPFPDEGFGHVALEHAHPTVIGFDYRPLQPPVAKMRSQEVTYETIDQGDKVVSDEMYGDVEFDQPQFTNPSFASAPGIMQRSAPQVMANAEYGEIADEPGQYGDIDPFPNQQQPHQESSYGEPIHSTESSGYQYKLKSQQQQQQAAPQSMYGDVTINDPNMYGDTALNDDAMYGDTALNDASTYGDVDGPTRIPTNESYDLPNSNTYGDFASRY